MLGDLLLLIKSSRRERAKITEKKKINGQKGKTGKGENVNLLNIHRTHYTSTNRASFLQG